MCLVQANNSSLFKTVIKCDSVSLFFFFLNFTLKSIVIKMLHNSKMEFLD